MNRYIYHHHKQNQTAVDWLKQFPAVILASGYGRLVLWSAQRLGGGHATEKENEQLKAKHTPKHLFNSTLEHDRVFLERLAPAHQKQAP